MSKHFKTKGIIIRKCDFGEADRIVTLLTDVSANFVNTDTDAKLCVYNNGGTVTIKNRLGSGLYINYDLNYLVK